MQRQMEWCENAWNEQKGSSTDLSDSGRLFGFRQPRFRLLNNVVDHFFQVSGLLKNAQLAIGAAPRLNDLVDVLQFLARIQFIDNVVDELQVFTHQIAR